MDDNTTGLQAYLGQPIKPKLVFESRRQLKTILRWERRNKTADRLNSNKETSNNRYSIVPTFKGGQLGSIYYEGKLSALPNVKFIRLADSKKDNDT